MEVMDFAEELIISSFLNSCIVSPNDKKLTTVPPSRLAKFGKNVILANSFFVIFAFTKRSL